MSQYALLYYTLLRFEQLDSPETARRREHRFWLERAARETRLRRRGIIRRYWNVLQAFHRDSTLHRAQRLEAPAARETLR
jgi:hypothetical protein